MSILLNNTRNMLENRLSANRNIAMLQPVQYAKVGLLNPFPADGESAGENTNANFAKANFGGIDFRDSFMHDRPTAFSRPYNNGVDMGRQTQAPYEGMSASGRRRSQAIDNGLINSGSVPDRTGDGLLYLQPDGTYKPYAPPTAKEFMPDITKQSGDGLPPPIPARMPDSAYEQEAPDVLGPQYRKAPFGVPRAAGGEGGGYDYSGMTSEQQNAAGVDGAAGGGYTPPTSLAAGYGSGGYNPAQPFKTSSWSQIRDWAANHLPAETLRDMRMYGLSLQDLFRGGVVRSGFGNSQPAEDRDMSSRAKRWRAMNDAGESEPFGQMERRMRGYY